jgi:hypothetical protein
MRWCALLVVLLSACADSSDVVERGVLYMDVIAPSTVALNQTFSVTVTTRGGGCIGFDSTSVQVTSDGATIIPYDRRHIPSENEGCTLILRPIAHEASLMFDVAGVKTLHVLARDTQQHDVDLPFELTVQ